MRLTTSSLVVINQKVLWPAFHYILPEYPRVNIKQLIAHSKAWQDFVRMNELFAESILDVYRPGDLSTIFPFQRLWLY